ncbi:hypothetical protein VOLCADRAFT_116238 [Volvox carteri f. nagariensis]|uniref:Uncharacterized protein n=1 Tax=Volvox carteri f. nagariensis TaxID=3068 RepID=D8TKB7_VOLCA|nr:uncharacterized protein VOLCADRAFT_116238 [Volvox carteri f. nagariensis]EFJ52032.1 hypothetical protein VOLCADRAFT_116238 [Volvox carteri f. nagariensis]|eukprot:XP_002946806.1 hypothetical protein VOLCADRAFT_116238 [Volvox carteri f. nagariensis]
MDRRYNHTTNIVPINRPAGNFDKTTTTTTTTSTTALAQPSQPPQPPQLPQRPLATTTTTISTNQQRDVTLPQPTVNLDIKPDADAPGRTSPVSFPLGPLSTPGSASCSRVNSRSYSPTPLLLDSDGSAQLRDPAFAYAPAVPDDDLVPILEGEPLTDCVSGQPLTAPSPLQQRQRKLQQELESASATSEPFPSTTPAANIASRTTQRQTVPTQSDGSDPPGYDPPRGAVNTTFRSAPPFQGGEGEVQQEVVTVATASVTASYIVSEEQAAELEQAAEELLLPAVAAAAAAAAAGEPQSPADLAATALLLLSGLTATAPPEEQEEEEEDIGAGAATLGGFADVATAFLGGVESFIPPTSSSAQAPFEFATAKPIAAHPQATASSMVRRKSAGPGPSSVAAVAGTPPAGTPPATTTAPMSGVSHPEWHDYSALPPRYKTTVEAVRSLAAARLMEQHWDAAEHLDVEVTWDAPPIYLQGRDPMRVAVWLAKWAAVVQLEPWMARWSELDSKRTRLDLLVEARVRPHRPWWLPASWLLPKQVTLKATLKLRISKGPAEDGSADVVTLIDGSIHNAPKLPMPAVWSPLVGLLGDPSYRDRAEEHPSVVQKATIAAQQAAAAAAERTHEAVTSTVGSAKAKVESAAEGAAGAADRMADAAAAAAGSGAGGGVLGGAKRVAHEAAEAVRGAVHEVADTVKGGVSAGAEKTQGHGRGHGHAEWKDYRHLHPRYRASVEALMSLAKARQMSDHRRPAEHMDLEITVDSPFMHLQGRENLRVAEYMAKWVLADVEVKPLMFKVRELDEKRTRLQVLLEVHLAPHRPLWAPATWLLPKVVVLEADYHLRISKGPEADGSSDVITAVDGKLLNLGKAPLPLRLLLGAALGYLPAATETFWSPFVGLLGDPSYRVEASVAAAEAGGGGGLVGKAKAAASAVVEKAQETVASATGGEGGGGALAAAAARAADQVQGAAAGAVPAVAAAADKTAGAVDATAQQVGNGGVKAKAVEAVRTAVHDVAGAVKGGVAAGAEKVTEAAGRAKKAVTGQA